MRYVVTAGAGFLGSALCSTLLDEGHDVVCADRPDRLARADASQRGAAPVPFDLAADHDPDDLLDGCDVLVHLAHRGLPSSPMAAIAQEAADNARGGLRLLEAARRRNVGRVVYASSGGTVYGRVDSLPVAENWPTQPISAYGVGKLALEGYLQFYAADFGLTCVSLRIGNAVGEGQFRGAGVGAPAKFLASVAAGTPLHIWGDGSIVRDYVVVDDIVRAFVLAARADLASGAYNVGSGTGHSLVQLVDIVRDVTGLDPDVRFEESRVFDVPSIVLDAGRFTAATGWSPQVELRDAMARMWEHLTTTGPSVSA